MQWELREVEAQASLHRRRALTIPLSHSPAPPLNGLQPDEREWFHTATQHYQECWRSAVSAAHCPLQGWTVTRISAPESCSPSSPAPMYGKQSVRHQGTISI